MGNPKSEIRAQLQAIAQVFSANTGVRKSQREEVIQVMEEEFHPMIV